METRRARRRGPRSHDALLRRRRLWNAHLAPKRPPGDSSRKSELESPVADVCFTITHVNLR
eukprot:3165406-Pyramimonas_sp.AAC.1